MKKLLLICSLIGIQAIFAQNIIFSDTNFKATLLNSNVGVLPVAKDLAGNATLVDSDNDGEISQQEALNISYINLGYAGITSLEGLQFFTNLNYLNAQSYALNSFNYPTLTNLKELYLESIVNQGALNSFDVSANINLRKLTLRSGNLTSIDLSNNTELTDLYLQGSTVTSLNLSNLSNLRTLNYSGNFDSIDLSDCTKLISLTLGIYNSTSGSCNLAAIDLTNQPLLINLTLMGTSVTSLDLSTNTNLENLYVDNNKIESINFGPLVYVRQIFCDNNRLTNLNVNNFQNLDALYCRNNFLTQLSLKNFKLETYVDFANNPGLLSICCDPEQYVYIQNQCLLNGNYDTVVGTNCTSDGVLLATNTVKKDTNAILVFPNPAQDYLYFDTEKEVTKLDIYDSNARFLKTAVLKNDKVNISELQSGLYFLKVYTNGTVSNIKIMKK